MITGTRRNIKLEDGEITISHSSGIYGLFLFLLKQDYKIQLET